MGPIKMTTVLPLSVFCTVIPLFLRRDFNVPKMEFDALKTLLNNKDIIVQKADKGNTVVILNPKTCVSKMKNIVNGKSEFKKFI